MIECEYGLAKGEILLAHSKISFSCIFKGGLGCDLVHLNTMSDLGLSPLEAH